MTEATTATVKSTDSFLASLANKTNSPAYNVGTQKKVSGFISKANQQLVAANLVIQRFTDEGYTVINKFSDKQAQADDIDFEICQANPATGEIISKRSVLMVRDSLIYRTRNLLVELIGNTSQIDRVGWGFHSKSDYLAVYDPTGGKLHMVEFAALRKFIVESPENKWTCVKSNTRHEASGKRWSGFSLLIPLKVVQKELPYICLDGIKPVAKG